MYNSGKVIIGIVIFAAIFSAPFWINELGSSNAPKKPDLVYPAGEKQCIMATDYMRNYHMDLLNQWRDLVVRQNQRYLRKDGRIVMIKGQPAEMSLTHTCLKCHDNKAKFCDECHNFMDVNPYCWECHVAPPPNNKLTLSEEGSNE